MLENAPNRSLRQAWSAPNFMKKAEVEEFIALHAAAAIAKARMDELKEILLPQLRAGEQSPPELSYLLERRVATGALIKDYRTPFLALLIRTWGKPAGERKLQLAEGKFQRKEDVESLHVVVNKSLVAQPALEQLRTA